MDSFLNVPAQGVLGAMKGVWASAFSARALSYRHRRQIPTTSISTAVIVQQMVQSEAAGILFTRDPQSRAEECVIVAGWGLGEGAVADKVETDTYRITRGDRVVARQVARKTRRLVRGAR